jgi:pimeloyl-ACP methyl ester carboxylesterase
MDQLRIDVACLVGHGVGGGVAQSLVTRWPHRVSRLSLISSVAFDAWPRPAAKVARVAFPLLRYVARDAALSLTRMALLRGFVDRERGAHDLDLYFRPFASDGGSDAFAAHVAALDSRETAALAPKLGEITAPVAIVWGENDPFLSQSVGARLAAAIPGSTFEVAPGARHFVPQEAPAVVATSVSTLLRR